MKYRRNWRETTHTRSFSEQMVGQANLNVKEIPAKIQLFKLERNMKENKRDIDKVDEKIRKNPKNTELVSRLLVSKNHKEKLYFRQTKRHQELVKIVKADAERQRTLAEKEKK